MRPDGDGNISQHAVACIMAKRVVDRFKVIQIDIRDRERLCVALHALHFRFNTLDETSPVSETGQRIGIRQAFLEFQPRP